MPAVKKRAQRSAPPKDKADPRLAAAAWIDTMADEGIIGHFRTKDAEDSLVALLVGFAKGASGADAFDMGVRWALVEAESAIGRLDSPQSREWGVDK